MQASPSLPRPPSPTLRQITVLIVSIDTTLVQRRT
jgi:hypothetical protein